MKPIVTIIRIILVGLIWSIFFLEGIRVILLTNWHFDLIDPRHWHYVWNLWMSGWVIDDRREWAFLLIIFSFIPLWLAGWTSLSLIRWENYIGKLWKKIVALYNRYIYNKEPSVKPEKVRTPTQRTVIQRKKSYKEIRPRNLNGISSPRSESAPVPSVIAQNRTLPNVQPIIAPSAPLQTSNNILDHSLFKFDEGEDDFDLNFDDLDKIQSAPKQQEQRREDIEDSSIEPSAPRGSDRKQNRRENSNKNNRDNQRDNSRKNNKPMPSSPQTQNHKNIGNSSLEVIKQKGYQVITSATIKNNFVDFIGVAEGQICICMVDKEAGDWLADEERFNDEEPLWFSESSHRVSPVRCADIVQEFLTQKLKENGFDFAVSTFVIIQYGNIINAEDMFETWNNMNINVTRIDRGMPRELKLFAKTLDEADNSIDIDRFEKIKKLIRNLA